MARQRAAALLCAALLPFLFSCAPVGKARQGERAPQELEEARPVIALARQSLAAGNHRQALVTLRTAYEENRRNGALKDAYLRAVEQTKKDADAAYAGKRYAPAGVLYDTLLRDGFVPADRAEELSFRREFVQERIRACSKALTRSGLARYREGKLEAAIVLWEQVLVFDRDNQEVKDSLATARTQLRSLEKL